MSFLDYITDQQGLDREQIRRQRKESGQSLEAVLLEQGVEADTLLNWKEEYYDLPSYSIGDMDIPDQVLELVPEESASYYRMIPFNLRDGVLRVGIVDPDRIEARDALNFISSKNDITYKLYVITEADFQEAVEKYGGLSGEVTKALSELEGELSSEEQDKDVLVQAPEDKTEEIAQGQEISEKDTIESGTIVEDAPVTKIVATILRYATEGKASDVHIEQMRENVRVRFRVDGVLNTSLILPTKVHPAVVARIKILSDMRLDEKRKPQDGRFSARIESRRIDFRVSTFPSYYGEKIVMRILDQEQGIRKLEELELREPHEQMIREAIKAPYGMILISGPTGSGKTTTLYSMLNMIDTERKNVLSLEDPVEYNIEGISQSQVRPDIDYTFASGLRHAVRQDPDVIMVGEIRDKETAHLAIHAALTGHLVLSTIHTNNAVGIVPRLIDMGIDPYLIAPTLILGMAQRLVSRLCEEAGQPKEINDSIRAMIEDQFSDLPEEYRRDLLPESGQVYETGSTANCPTGTKGRIAVMEVLKMNKKLERVILDNPSENAVYKAARAQGMVQMKEDALIKSMWGRVPFSEVNTL